MKNELEIRPIKKTDIRPLWEVMYGPESDLTWMQTNGPYFQDPVYGWEVFSEIGKKMVDNPHRAVIVYKNRLIGTCSADWVDGDLQRWLEFGLAIFVTDLRGRGLGTGAMREWMGQLFAQHPAIRHLGFSSYSGNPAMMRLGERCGLQLEARIPQVRFWQGKWFDALKYGILRADWERMQ